MQYNSLIHISLGMLNGYYSVAPDRMVNNGIPCKLFLVKLLQQQGIRLGDLNKFLRITR